MTMHIVYLKDFEGHKVGDSGFEERTRARRLCNNGVVEPYMTYMKRQKPVETATLVEPEPEKKPEPVVEAAPEKDAIENEPPKRKPGRPRGRKKKSEKATRI